MKLKIFISITVLAALIAGGFLLQHWMTITSTSQKGYPSTMDQTEIETQVTPVTVPTNHKPEDHTDPQP